MTDESRPNLDIVCTVYNDAEMLERLTAEIATSADRTGLPWRIIYVCDGSPDDSWSVLERIARERNDVTALELARNFGQHIAVSAGLDFSTADYVIVMDSDLQDPPTAIPDIVLKLRDDDFDIVYCRRLSRHDSLLKRFSSAVFWRGLKFLTGQNIVIDQLMLRGMSRRYVRAFQSIRERDRFIGGLSAWLGFRQGVIDVDSGKRGHGKSNYSMRRLVSLSLDAITSLSLAPLRFATILGFTVTAASMAYAVYIVVRALFGEPMQPGFATITLMVAFFSGVILLVLGIIGEYLGRTLRESQMRPLYFVRQVSGADSEAASRELPLPPRATFR